MTTDQAEAVLGAELTADVRAQAAARPPLTAAQADLIAALLDSHPDQADTQSVA